MNKEYRNSDFSIITSNEALAINLDLSNNQNVTLATIYCPNGNPNLSLFHTINNLSDNVTFVGDFNSKLESFGCAKKNASGPMLQNIQKQLNLIYLNTDEHMHLDRANGSTDMLDMAFISPNLAKHDIQFQIGDYLGSNHLPIEISIDTSPHKNTFTNHIKYKFDQTDREVLESTLEEALGSADFSGHLYIIVAQLNKCLKFEPVWGVLTDQMISVWTKRYNETDACIVVHRMARHNHLIDRYYLFSSFVKLMMIEYLKSFT